MRNYGWIDNTDGAIPKKLSLQGFNDSMQILTVDIIIWGNIVYFNTWLSFLTTTFF